MRSSRLTALVILGGLLAGGLVLDAADSEDSAPPAQPAGARAAMPAAAPEGSLSSTWYCAGGTASDDGIADHVVLIANPTDQPRRAVVSVLTGVFAAAGVDADTTASSTTSTAPPQTTTTKPPPAPPAPKAVDIPAQSRVEVSLRQLVKAPLASAIVEVEGGEVAVEHEITTLAEGGGRATAPCSATASQSWSFPWGVTSRGARELMVFMNPFPDDATVTIDFATDKGSRQALRFQNFVVPGRSVVGAYIDQDVTRRTQVSAQVHVGSGRLVVDRIQTFDGTDPALEGITLGLGAPRLAEVWTFPFGVIDPATTERVVVFNPTDDVAEVEVEALEDPDKNGVPEPFEATIAPHRYGIIDLAEPDLEVTATTPRRIPDGVNHSIIVRSLNGVPVAAEKVMTRAEPSPNQGVGSMLGSPLAAPTWLLAAGGVSDERAEVVTVFNASDTEAAHFSIDALSEGRRLVIEGLQDLELPPGGRQSISMHLRVDLEELPLVVSADRPVAVERGFFRRNGRGISLSMGIPVDQDILVFDPIDG
ncbi:MAG: DUF5719 family protein [Acidimicrobiales bacterium]